VDEFLGLLMEKTQFLTFFIGDEIFALEVLRIKEIIPFSKVTKIPLMQSYISGIMNVRGDIVPILDLAKRVALDVKSSSDKLSVVIVSIMYENKDVNIGMVVHQVNKVFEQSSEELELSPIFGSNIKKDFIKQIAKVDGDFIPILDIDKLLNLDEISITLQPVSHDNEK
jgi:purine-binding chemotaxis protein CheW